MIYVYLANGFEETEMIAPLDLIRRAGLDVKTVSITKDALVCGSHGIAVKADTTVFEKDYDYKKAEMLMLPGGMPGTLGLEASAEVREALLYAAENGRYISAICAAPSVLGKLGLLEGKRAVCYPGFERYLTGALHTDARCERDGNFITAVGMGAAIEFGLKIVETLCGRDTSENLKNGILA